MEDTEIKKEEEKVNEEIIRDTEETPREKEKEEEQKEQEEEKIDEEKPEEIKKSNKSLIIISASIGIVIGIILALAFVQFEISPQWVTDSTLDNQTTQSYNLGWGQGWIDAANYTSVYGNFTYLYEDRYILTQNLFEYCGELVQNLNSQLPMGE